MNKYDPTFDLKINVGHCDLFSWSSDCALYLEYFMFEHHYLGWSCDFALYIEDYLMYVHHSFGV